MHEIPSAQPAPLDRSDAVNLARNLLEVRDCKGITERGVRVLCDAVMAMDQALTAAPAATQAPTVEEAIALLKIALRDSKGWMQDYSDSIIRDAIDRVATQAQAEPVAWMAFSTLYGRPLALPEYAAADAPGVMGKVLDVALKEGFRGTGKERMQQLGWWAAPVHLAASAPVGDGPTQPVGEEGIHQWPIAEQWSEQSGISGELAGMERAAIICDGLTWALDNAGNQYRREACASKCASAIREVAARAAQAKGGA